MRFVPNLSALFCNLSRLTIACVILACAPSTESARIPAAPVALRWPDPTFLPERQCRGKYSVEELNRLMSRARLALWLPATRSVVLDQRRRCLTVTVAGVGDGRLAELLFRGVGVPRRAVLLVLDGAGEKQRS